MKTRLCYSEKKATFEVIILEKRLLDALFLTIRNSRKIQSSVKDEAMVDARGCNSSPVSLLWLQHGEILRLITSVRFSPLPSYATRQCEKPLMVGRQRESDPTLFLCHRS